MQAWHRLTPDKKSADNGTRYGESFPSIPDEYEYLPEFLREAGTAGSGINGLTRITHVELEAWARMMNYTLTRFEVTALRAMSAAYCSIANDPDSDCPVDNQEIRERIDDANAATWDNV